MKTILTTITLLFTLAFLNAQIVSTVTDGFFSDGLGIDSQGNIYGSDYGGDSVFKYDPITGTVSTFQTGYSNPNGIGVNAQDEIYICDHTGGTIFKYDLDGNELDSFSGIITPAGIKNIPGTNDMLFVTYNTSTINILQEDGTIDEVFSGPPINGPAGIAFIDGTAYIGNFIDRRIFKYEAGTVTLVAQLPAGAANTNFLGFLSAKDGYLLATQIGENKIYKIDPTSGIVTLLAGSTSGGADGSLETATFNRPNGILADEANNRIYISDANPRNLRIIEGINLSVEDLFSESIQLKVLTNPTRDIIQISMETVALSNFSLRIHDTLGREVYNQKINRTNGTFSKELDISNWPSGIYMVQVSGEKFSETQKFIK